VRYAFPVPGRSSYGRTHALYPATDIFAACGSPVVSPVDGVVLEANRVDRFDPAHPDGAWKGGRFVSIAGDDGVRHYGSHLLTIRDAIRPGVRVAAGQPVGTVGRTGNANNVCHLHYALSPLCARTGDWWLRRGVVYPWPFLDRWRRGLPANPHAAVATWQRQHGCPHALP
jgi:murein DD-endopeptidase MepM/ murein hydrolase activator NlpD